MRPSIMDSSRPKEGCGAVWMPENVVVSSEVTQLPDELVLRRKTDWTLPSACICEESECRKPHPHDDRLHTCS